MVFINISSDFGTHHLTRASARLLNSGKPVQTTAAFQFQSAHNSTLIAFPVRKAGNLKEVWGFCYLLFTQIVIKYLKMMLEAALEPQRALKASFELGYFFHSKKRGKRRKQK